MINLKDKLSHLNFRQACKLLGPKGERLIRSGGKYGYQCGSAMESGCFGAKD